MSDIETLKEWCAWQRKHAPEWETNFVKSVEDLISQVGTWKAKAEKLRDDCHELREVLSPTDLGETFECQSKINRRLALAERVVEAARDLGMGCTVDDQWTAHPAISYVEIQVEKDARIEFLAALVTYDAMKREINERK
jgi:hypothetical protein